MPTPYQINRAQWRVKITDLIAACEDESLPKNHRANLRFLLAEVCISAILRNDDAKERSRED